jgi:galactose mutarotase-like enzyme
MNVVGNTCAVRREQGFDVFILSNHYVELAVVPELGGRIISLKDLRTSREWLWHPAGGLKLFRNRPDDKFESSPLVGMDECLPTIAPCVWRGRHLPDHGEVWASAWSLDSEAWERGLLRTGVQLKISPFDFERTIELQENEVRLSYRLDNRGAEEELYLWTMHPLLRLQTGDELELPSSTRVLLDRVDWLDTLGSGRPKGVCEKIFASGLSEGRVAIHNPETGDRLQFHWDAAENNTLGLWLNRGGWHGHDHFALEPASGKPDLLTVAAQNKSCASVPARGSIAWQVCIQVGD